MALKNQETGEYLKVVCYDQINRAIIYRIYANEDDRNFLGESQSLGYRSFQQFSLCENYPNEFLQKSIIAEALDGYDEIDNPLDIDDVIKRWCYELLRERFPGWIDY